MKTTVEGFPKACRVKGRATIHAFHQCWDPVPMLVIDPKSIGPAMKRIAAMVAEVERSRSCGAYLFINPQMEAFVISEEKPIALLWTKSEKHWRWMVGFYRSTKPKDPRVPVLRPCLDGITEDVIDHLRLMECAA